MAMTKEVEMSDLLGGDLTVVLPFFVLVSLPLGIFAAWLILKRYRQVVMRVMGSPSSVPQNPAVDPGIGKPSALSLGRPLQIRIEEADAAPQTAVASHPLARRGKKAVRYRWPWSTPLPVRPKRWLSLLYFSIKGSGLRLYPLFVLWLTLAWPISLSVMEILLATPRRKWLIPGAILIGLVLILPGDGRMLVLVVWPVWVAIPVIISAAAFHPKVRTACRLRLASRSLPFLC